MSLPAMLVGETLGEILQASQFAREIVSAVGVKTPSKENPKTPMSQRSRSKLNLENTQLKARRNKEKQAKLQNDGSPPSLQKARSRITFKVSPPKVREFDRENNKYLSSANRVSPRNRPWAKKTVLFPNPLFLSTHSSSSQSQQQQFCKTRSPIISRNKGTTTTTTTVTPHKFLIKSPPSKNSKFQVQIKSTNVSISPTRLASFSKNSPKRSAASKFRRSFSPSRLANRLVSPLRSKKSTQKSDVFVSGLKQRPASTMQFPTRRI